MKNQLPPICNGVVILDFTGRQIVKYADVAISSPFPVYHLPQSLIERLHRTARKMPLTLLADLYASILKLPQRKKGGHHGT